MKNKPVFKWLKKRERKNLIGIIADMPIEITSKDGKIPDILVQKLKEQGDLCFSISPLNSSEYIINRTGKDGIFYFFNGSKKMISFAEPKQEYTKYYFFRIV
ncbi:hypothetical protein HYX16_00290 [Candidatus Woesearchaeota archaeon]|nr:hypothetical protein [Candidatus Woesearchaeota archaeon]